MYTLGNVIQQFNLYKSWMVKSSHENKSSIKCGLGMNIGNRITDMYPDRTDNNIRTKTLENDAMVCCYVF